MDPYPKFSNNPNMGAYFGHFSGAVGAGERPSHPKDFFYGNKTLYKDEEMDQIMKMIQRVGLADVKPQEFGNFDQTPAPSPQPSPSPPPSMSGPSTSPGLTAPTNGIGSGILADWDKKRKEQARRLGLEGIY